MRIIFKKDIEEIIKGCVDGNRAAQRKLYDLHVEKMLAVCMRYAQDRSEAEDMVQDGFIRVFRKIDTFKGLGSFEGWVRRVMVNTAIRYCQNRQKMYKVISLDDMHEEIGDEMLDAEFAYDELMGMINSLPEGYKLVFNLYAVEGYSHKEIGQQLGISEGTSKSQLARARQHLKAMVIKHRQVLENRKNGQSAG